MIMSRHYLGPFRQQTITPPAFHPQYFSNTSLQIHHNLGLTGIVILSPKIMYMTNYTGNALCSKQRQFWPINIPGTKRRTLLSLDIRLQASQKTVSYKISFTIVLKKVDNFVFTYKGCSEGNILSRRIHN